jgi:hypothetical protein
LGPHGFDHAEVKPGVDHAGEDALFITADLKPGAPFIEGEVSDEALGGLIHALRKRGDRRFPYLHIRHPDQERAEPPSGPEL